MSKCQNDKSELASSGCSAQVDLPARLLRLVVQVEDTPENRKALLAVRETAMTRSFTAGHSVVKLEHVIVVGCDAPNDQAHGAAGGGNQPQTH